MGSVGITVTAFISVPFGRVSHDPPPQPVSIQPEQLAIKGLDRALPATDASGFVVGWIHPGVPQLSEHGSDLPPKRGKLGVSFVS